MMKLYNTLSKQVEELQPLTDVVRVYSCGPTVYDQIHIGNLSSFIFADTLRRTIEAQGLAVKHVINFTDIDDKTIARSHQAYPELDPMTALQKLTADYSRQFLIDNAAIGNDNQAVQWTKATDYIPKIQALIRDLVAQDYAYLTDDGIYFSISRYQQSGKIYGQLSHISDASTGQSRIQNDEYDKASAHDFALWKRQKTNEPAWPFEINGQAYDGRPGWHIECSVMSKASLDQPFDIHTGGVDLIFPHHENEIVQSTALQISPLYARQFVHHEHLLIDGQKMSKSQNNFYTLQTVTDRGFDPLAFRLFVLQAHYRTQSHFSWENLQAAQNRLRDLRAMAVLRWQPRELAHDAGTFALEDVPLQLAATMAEDLNTPQALAYLSDVTNQLLAVHIEKDMVDHFEAMLQGIDNLLGLNLLAEPDITDQQKQLIADREQARQTKNWSRSDELRNELKQQGIELKDFPHGVIWSR